MFTHPRAHSTVHARSGQACVSICGAVCAVGKGVAGRQGRTILRDWAGHRHLLPLLIDVLELSVGVCAFVRRRLLTAGVHQDRNAQYDQPVR
jgi:hypothetical protein